MNLKQSAQAATKIDQMAANPMSAQQQETERWLELAARIRDNQRTNLDFYNDDDSSKDMSALK